MDLKYELSQDREVVAVVIGNRLNISQQRTAVDHKPNTTRRGWELEQEQGQKGGADLSLQSSLHHADDDGQVRIMMMMWMIMIVSSLSHHDIRKICKNDHDFEK